MRTKHIFVIWSCIRIKGGFRCLTDPPSLSPVDFLLSFLGRFLCRSLSVCPSVVLYAAFVLSLFVPHLPFFWPLGKAALRDWGYEPQ